MDWKELRALFPATEGQAYLNTASYGPGPLPVARAVQRENDRWMEGRGDWRNWEKSGELARELVAGLLGVRSGHVSLQPAVSVAVSQVAERLPHRPGANLVVGEQEFRSLLYPWLNQRRRGFDVRTVPFREGRLALDDLRAAIDRDTALVAVSSVQSSTGHRTDLEAVGEACRAVGARLFVDGTQSIGALQFPAAVPDYIAFAGYKWLLAPRGAAFLVLSSERVVEMAPLCPGWKTPEDPYAGYYGPPFDVSSTADRFDVSLAWPVWVGMAEALRLIYSIGIERIEQRDLELAGLFRAGLEDVGLEPLLPEEESSQIVSLRVPDADALQRELDAAGVVAAVRDGYLRTSFHFYNDESDVERALGALERAVRRAR